MGCFDHTKGLLPDAFMYRIRRLYIPTIEKDFAKEITNILGNSNQKMLIVPHSRGCVDVRNTIRKLPHTIQQRIYVLAVAPGGYISRHLPESYISDNNVRLY